jgi:hypothetical protein
VQGPEFGPQHRKKGKIEKKSKRKETKKNARQLSGKVLNCVFIFFIV